LLLLKICHLLSVAKYFFTAIVGTPLAGAIYDYTNSYDIPFYTAGALFGLSAIASFLGMMEMLNSFQGLKLFFKSIAPVAVKYRRQPESPIHVEVLTPIEENEEYEDDEDNQPITMGKCKYLKLFTRVDNFILKIKFFNSSKDNKNSTIAIIRASTIVN
jgi:hypothetical protein